MDSETQGRIWISAVSLVLFLLLVHAPVFGQDHGYITVTVAGYDATSQPSLMPGERATVKAAFFCETVTFAILQGTIRCASWSAKLRPRLVLAAPGPHEVSWAESIPSYALGLAQVDITLKRLFREHLAGSTDFDIRVDLSAYTGAEGCQECHETNFAAWSRSRHAPIPACEACHGPGRRHDEADTEEFIFMDTAGLVCLQCHIENDGKVIEAEDGFIKYYQEHNEINRTAHGRYGNCITCHNPHFNMREDRKHAVRRSCRICHLSKRVALHPSTIMCEDCHMPKAAMRERSEGEGLYRRGDFASHIMRIKISAAPEDMFTAYGTVLAEDDRGPFLTLNFACLSCHDGMHAGKADFQSVRNAAKLIHAR